MLLSCSLGPGRIEHVLRKMMVCLCVCRAALVRMALGSLSLLLLLLDVNRMSMARLVRKSEARRHGKLLYHRHAAAMLIETSSRCSPRRRVLGRNAGVGSLSRCEPGLGALIRPVRLVLGLMLLVNHVGARSSLPPVIVLSRWWVLAQNSRGRIATVKEPVASSVLMTVFAVEGRPGSNAALELAAVEVIVLSQTQDVRGAREPTSEERKGNTCQSNPFSFLGKSRS